MTPRHVWVACLITLMACLGNARVATETGKQISLVTMDRDLLEITVPRLHELYARHIYTVTQVVQWYLARVAKYDGIYRSIENVDTAGALRTAAQEDAAAQVGGPSFKPGPRDVSEEVADAEIRAMVAMRGTRYVQFMDDQRVRFEFASNTERRKLQVALFNAGWLTFDME